MPKFAIVVVSPPGYIHSEAFREVAQAIFHGLEKAGCDVVWSDTPFVGGRIPIVFGANLVAHAWELPAHAVVFNLEQIDSQSAWMKEPYLSILRTHVVWDYSARNVEMLRDKGISRICHMPIGHVPELERIEPAAEKDIDVLFYGSLNPRRQAVIDQIKSHGLNVVSVFGVYGEKRDALIARARIVLNMHFYEAKTFEIVRIAYLLGNGVCVVSEGGTDPAEQEFAGAIAFASYESIAERCVELLGRPEERAHLAAQGLAAMRARPQEQYVQNCLDSSPLACAPPRVVPTVLNIGSGKDWKANCINIDISPEWNPDLIMDLNKPLPAEGWRFDTGRFGEIQIIDDAFDAIICNDVLEHILINKQI